MAPTGFALFETAVGTCGIAWSAAGVAGVQLPEPSAAATRARMQRRYPAAPEGAASPAAQHAIDAIAALLARGEAGPMAAVVLDTDGVPAFDRAVYDAARAIAPGVTCTYGELAARLGAPGAARAIGQALGRNPFPIVVPCHRVLAAGGRVGGFSAPGGAATKLRLLAIERAAGHGALPLFDRPRG